MQGFAFNKPHGYAGDYEIIDRIYQTYIASDSHLSRWDKYWQAHAAAEAVRNRKTYFHQVLDIYSRQSGKPSIEVLNVASGPGRDMLEYLERQAGGGEYCKVYFHCIEQDPRAIQYASHLCHAYLDQVSFVQRNALRFRPQRTYDLVWSAGLFDYFDDALFVTTLSRLLKATAADGELVVGNFSTQNPSRAFMEIFDWHLHHRSPQTLRYLARHAGAQNNQITIGREPRGVNLFLHIRPDAGQPQVELRG